MIAVPTSTSALITVILSQRRGEHLGENARRSLKKKGNRIRPRQEHQKACKVVVRDLPISSFDEATFNSFVDKLKLSVDVNPSIEEVHQQEQIG